MKLLKLNLLRMCPLTFLPYVWLIPQFLFFLQTLESIMIGRIKYIYLFWREVLLFTIDLELTM